MAQFIVLVSSTARPTLKFRAEGPFCSAADATAYINDILHPGWPHLTGTVLPLYQIDDPDHPDAPASRHAQDILRGAAR